MPATIYIDDISELPEVYASIEEDFNAIDFEPFMAKELDPLADWHRGLFDNQRSPDGSSWAANKQSTIKQKGHNKVLRGLRQSPDRSRKGVKRAQRFARFRLSNSLTLKAHQSVGDAIREAVGDHKGAGLTFGTTVPYSVFHDKGGDHFPARQHVGINSEYLDEMTERALDYTMAQLAKG